MIKKLLFLTIAATMIMLSGLAAAGPRSAAAAPPAAAAGGICHELVLPLIVGGGAGAGVPGAPAPLDCGPALELVDFNKDGYADLAIGIPDEDRSALVLDSGAVQIIYGAAGGLNAADSQYWTQTDTGAFTEAGEEFGRGLAAGDFDGDGATDLAVGSPGEHPDGKIGAGQVNILYGAPATGLTAAGSQTFAQGVNGVAGVGEAGDRFGEVLAGGDFNGDGYDDLAVGAPDEGFEAGGLAEIGAVNILYGSAAGLTAAGNQIVHLGLPEILLAPGAQDHFGEALAAADFDNDGHDDLAVGLPGFDIAGEQNVGAVLVLRGSENGISLVGETAWRQGFNGIQGAPEANDGFGRALAAGDFDGNGGADLAVGAPGEDVAFGGGDVVDAGAIHIIYGYALTGGLDGSGDQLWHQGLNEVFATPQTLDRFGHALAAADFDGSGADDLAVGVPFEDGTATDQGYVHVFYSNGSILAAAGQDLWTQGQIEGVPEFEDYFGYALGGGDYNGDGSADLVVGVPYEDVLAGGADRLNAGALNVIYGSSSGLTATGNQIWSQETPGIDGDAATGDLFGWAVTR